MRGIICVLFVTGLSVAKLTREGEDAPEGRWEGCSPVSASLGGQHFLTTPPLPPPGCLGEGREAEEAQLLQLG